MLLFFINNIAILVIKNVTEIVKKYTEAGKHVEHGEKRENDLRTRINRMEKKVPKVLKMP
jgi:hypothetical protein